MPQLREIHPHTTRLLERASRIASRAEEFEREGARTLARLSHRRALRLMAEAAAAPMWS